MKKLTEAERFFYKYAGYSWDMKKETAAQGRRRCARRMAQAEAYADAHDWTFTLEGDEDFDWERGAPDGANKGCCAYCNTPLDRRGACPKEHYVYGAVLKDAEGTVLASVWGVVDPSDEYARVLKGELASEALHQVEGEEAAEDMVRRHFAL